MRRSLATLIGIVFSGTSPRRVPHAVRKKRLPLTIEPLETRLTPHSYTFVPAGAGLQGVTSWTTPGVWEDENGAAVANSPTSADSVLIPANESCVIAAGAVANAGALVVQGTLDVVGNLTAASAIVSKTPNPGGSLIVEGDATFSNGANFDGDTTIQVKDTGNLESTGIINVSSASIFALSGGTIAAAALSIDSGTNSVTAWGTVTGDMICAAPMQLGDGRNPLLSLEVNGSFQSLDGLTVLQDGNFMNNVQASGNITLYGTLDVRKGQPAPQDAFFVLASATGGILTTDRFTKGGTIPQPTFPLGVTQVYRGVFGPGVAVLDPVPQVNRQAQVLINDNGLAANIDIANDVTTYVSSPVITELNGTALACFSGTLPSGATASANGSIVTYTPSSGSYTGDSLQYTFGDDPSNLASPDVATGSIAIIINRQPSLDTIPNVSIVQGRPLTTTFNASDLNLSNPQPGYQEYLSFVKTNGPDWVWINYNSGDTSGTVGMQPPIDTAPGTYPVTIEVDDANGLYDRTTFNVVVLQAAPAVEFPISGVTDIPNRTDPMTGYPFYNGPSFNGTWVLLSSGTGADWQTAADEMADDTPAYFSLHASGNYDRWTLTIWNGYTYITYGSSAPWDFTADLTMTVVDDPGWFAGWPASITVSPVWS